jgi:hypothetical protein
MADRHKCGVQTEYYKTDLPTCPTCSAGLNPEPKPPPTPMPIDAQLGLPHD